MDTLEALITPALMVALIVWLRHELNGRISRFEVQNEKQFREVEKQFREVKDQLTGVNNQMGELRERMARLDGAIDGFVAGRRDRDAA